MLCGCTSTTPLPHQRCACQYSGKYLASPKVLWPHTRCQYSGKPFVSPVSYGCISLRNLCTCAEWLHKSGRMHQGPFKRSLPIPRSLYHFLSHEFMSLLMNTSFHLLSVTSMCICCTVWFILTAAKLQQYVTARLSLKIKCKNTVDKDQIYKKIHLFIFWEDITNANKDRHNKRAPHPTPPPIPPKKENEEVKLEQM